MGFGSAFSPRMRLLATLAITTLLHQSAAQCSPDESKPRKLRAALLSRVLCLCRVLLGRVYLSRSFRIFVCGTLAFILIVVLYRDCTGCDTHSSPPLHSCPCMHDESLTQPH